MLSRRRGTHIEDRCAWHPDLIPGSCPCTATAVPGMSIDKREGYGAEDDLEYGEENDCD